MKIRTNLASIAEEYIRACRLIPALIEASERKPEYFYKSLGMGKTTYYQRLKLCDWTPEEVMKIAELLVTG